MVAGGSDIFGASGVAPRVGTAGSPLPGSAASYFQAPNQSPLCPYAPPPLPSTIAKEAKIRPQVAGLT